MRRRFSIKNALRYNMLAVLAIISVTIFIYYVSVDGYSRRQINESHVRLSAMANRQLDTLLASSTDNVRRSAYAASVQALMFTRSPLEYIRNRPSAVSFLETTVFDNPLVSDIYVYNENGRALFYNTAWDTRKRYINIIRREILPSGDLSPRFFTSLYIDAANEPQTELLYYMPVYNVRMLGTPESGTAHCIVSCNADAFWSVLSMGLYEQETVAILYDNNVISSNRDMSPLMMEAVYSNREAVFSGTKTIGGVNYLCDLLPLADLGEWEMAYLVPEEALLRHIFFLRNISIVLLVASVIALTFFIESVIRAVYRQVSVLDKSIQAVRDGSQELVSVPYVAELVPVGENFNEAIKAMRDSREKEKEVTHELYRSIIGRQTAMINSYKYQITPHFLFNTMETMRSMAHNNRGREVERLIRSTSAFLRYTLRENTSVTFEKELEFINIYFDIMDVRFPGRFKLRVGVTEEAKGCEILTTVLQPLVENCAAHAAGPGRNPLQIYIMARTTEEDSGKYLNVRVVDNGSGIPEDKMRTLREDMEREITDSTRMRIGLNNTYHRLLLHFGEGFRMNVRTKLNHYTSVELKIPQPAGTTCTLPAIDP